MKGVINDVLVYFFSLALLLNLILLCIAGTCVVLLLLNILLGAVVTQCAD
jgi:hypothetical protein